MIWIEEVLGEDLNFSPLDPTAVLTSGVALCK